MANYIYNYIKCSKDVADLLSTEELANKIFYWEFVRKTLDKDRELIIFDTKVTFDDKGNVEYDEKRICDFINRHKETEWICVEEQMSEIAHFSCFDNKIICSKRNLHQDNESILCYHNYDYDLRPYEILFIDEDGKVCKEDIVNNKCTEVTISDEMLAEIWEQLIDYYRILIKHFYVVIVKKDEPHKEFMVFRDEHIAELISAEEGEYTDSINGVPIANAIIRLINNTIGTINEEFLISEIIE